MMCLVTKINMVQDKELVGKILESLNKVAFMDRRRVIIYDDLKLYPSEIHLLLFLHYVQDKNITNIAYKMGLTKGAISQTLSRLYNKGIIKKETDPHKKNELHAHFTTKGQKLAKHIIEVKNSIESKYLTYLKTLSERDKNVISEFLDKMVSILHNKYQLS